VKAVSVTNFLARRAIHEHLGADRGQQRCDPISPARRETKVLQHLQKEGPRDGIKCARNVDL
jgi:hypothetical protein